MSKPRIAIVVGGESGEHDVSLASGAEVIKGVDMARWEPFIVRVGRDGAWFFPEGQDVRGPAPALALGDGINELARRAPACVFPVMHGPYGEDGRFQALMDLMHLRYVGSPAEASSLAMNKARARDVFEKAGLTVARAEELGPGDTPTLKAPCVVKPMHMGSSVGLMVARTEAALAQALADAFAHDTRVLVEDFVAGRELTAGVLERPDGTLQSLPLVEIRPLTSDFFDFKAKYTPGASEEICPAPIDDELTRRVQAIGITAHKALGCRGMSRSDVIVGTNGVPVILETNTIPGMTATSLLPQAAKAAGLSFGALIDRLLEGALA